VRTSFIGFEQYGHRSGSELLSRVIDTRLAWAELIWGMTLGWGSSGERWPFLAGEDYQFLLTCRSWFVLMAEICKAAFEKALFVWPNEHLEMRQGARIILKSEEGA